jgi:hypothetical protein
LELFEILFLALFILFPIVEQLLRRSRGGDAEEPGPDPMEAPPGEIDPPSSEREPIQASEMVPDDLWAILTGERRPEAEEGAAEEGHFEEAGDAWEAVDFPEEAEAPWVNAEPARSTEGYDAEASSLDSVDPEPAYFERPLPPSPEERHRRFHAKYDRPEPPPRRRRRSTIGRALGDPDSLRQAFVLNEVLGTPKGLV